jgi:exodeoxyribonuclease VII large subunit
VWDENLPKGTNYSPAKEPTKPDLGTYLSCTFNDKDECKSLGGKWDPNMKKWYVPQGVDTTPFKKWL